jgi:2-oxoglutarate ferredoxin oxidoreductase subunit beta
MADQATRDVKLTKKDFVSDQDVRWCPGCGDYAILAFVQRVLPELGVPREKFVFVSGIGCSSRFPYYVNTYGLHTIHGRAPAIATGVKAANPDLQVWVVTGDGDALSIGGNHLIHAARRDMPITVICANNSIYGMTGGQASSTTPVSAISKTTPAGNIEMPFDLCKLVIGAGATYAARFPVVPLKPLIKSIINALNHEGFSFIDVLSPCPTYFGRMNRMKRPVEMFDDLKKRCKRIKKGEKVKEGIIPIGEFVG